MTDWSKRSFRARKASSAGLIESIQYLSILSSIHFSASRSRNWRAYADVFDELTRCYLYYSKNWPTDRPTNQSTDWLKRELPDRRMKSSIELQRANSTRPQQQDRKRPEEGTGGTAASGARIHNKCSKCGGGSGETKSETGKIWRKIESRDISIGRLSSSLDDMRIAFLSDVI